VTAQRLARSSPPVPKETGLNDDIVQLELLLICLPKNLTYRPGAFGGQDEGCKRNQPTGSDRRSGQSGWDALSFVFPGSGDGRGQRKRNSANHHEYKPLPPHCPSSHRTRPITLTKGKCCDAASAPLPSAHGSPDSVQRTTLYWSSSTRSSHPDASPVAACVASGFRSQLVFQCRPSLYPLHGFDY
jgi:hypothetical protein